MGVAPGARTLLGAKAISGLSSCSFPIVPVVGWHGTQDGTSDERWPFAERERHFIHAPKPYSPVGDVGGEDSSPTMALINNGRSMTRSLSLDSLFPMLIPHTRTTRTPPLPDHSNQSGGPSPGICRLLGPRRGSGDDRGV